VPKSNDLQWRGLPKGVRFRRVLARKPSRRPGRYCIRLSRVFTSAVSSVMLRLARLARDLLRCDQTCSTGLSSCAYGGSWQTVSQSRAATQLAHRTADVRVQVVPDDYERSCELLVGGVEQPGVVGLGEALAPVAAAVDAIDQPGLASRPDADERCQGHSRVVRAGHFHHRGLAAPAPGASFRRT
jgi:hypothetical protein